MDVSERSNGNNNGRRTHYRLPARLKLPTKRTIFCSAQLYAYFMISYYKYLIDTRNPPNTPLFVSKSLATKRNKTVNISSSMSLHAQNERTRSLRPIRKKRRKSALQRAKSGKTCPKSRVLQTIFGALLCWTRLLCPPYSSSYTTAHLLITKRISAMADKPRDAFVQMQWRA